jgi:hypothetical protein
MVHVTVECGVAAGGVCSPGRVEISQWYQITLYRTGPKADFEDRYPRVGPLLTRRLNTADHGHVGR